MMIHTISNLADSFDTNRTHLESALSKLAHLPVTVDNTPTSVRISHTVEDCNADLSCTFQYPFESTAVIAFLISLESTVVRLLNIYDDPLNMLMNTTNPGQAWTIEDAGRCLSEAEANGWKFAPNVDPQYILDLYNDMEPEEEED